MFFICMFSNVSMIVYVPYLGIYVLHNFECVFEPSYEVSANPMAHQKIYLFPPWIKGYSVYHHTAFIMSESY